MKKLLGSFYGCRFLNISFVLLRVCRRDAIFKIDDLILVSDGLSPHERSIYILVEPALLPVYLNVLPSTFLLP